MSASCVVNRAELLSMLEEVREALPGSLAEAQDLIGDRDQLVAQARQEAERIIEGAHAERGSLVSGTEIARRSQAESERILTEAQREAEEIRAEADDYVDSKLANFEVVLTKTLGSVGRGREKLLGKASGVDDDGFEDPDYADAPERSQDPETLRRRADDYVDVKLGAFEAVLAKTLEAVGRGRQKLHGRAVTDELGTLSGDGPTGHTTDAEFLAELAGDARPVPSADGQDVRVPAQLAAGGADQPYGAQPPEPSPVYAPQGQDAYATGTQQIYAATSQDQQAPYAEESGPYGAHDPYAYQEQGYQQDGATYGGQDGYQGQEPYGGYPQEGYGRPDPYAYAQQDAYNGYPQQGQQGYDPGYDQTPQGGSGALDETSLFDTSMISAEQLRAYEQGRGQ
jgi:vacuolar-type H+-ATPase subunit H